MRTKHLFYTAAMAALFAACVNDDFETIAGQQDAVNDGRPVAGNVKLDFTKGGGADTRMSYEGQEIGYQWEATDEIGALLMDNVVVDQPESEEWTWLQKYQLVDDIHTSYRFTYDANNKVWGCDAKMLEGNYFFAYPWESYDGERRVKHSLTDQTQEGVGAEIRRESYAKNQFFIGYSQIMAGTEDTEVLDSSVEMVPVLGAIQLQIVNTGTQTRHINKVVLKSNHLYSTLTFDPTHAEYGKWNLSTSALSSGDVWNVNGDEKFFNYANYTGNEIDTYKNNANSSKVYNITGKETEKYERNEALRAVVAQDPTDDDNYAQITITGTPEQRALVSTSTDQDAVAYVLIMANAVEDVTAKVGSENGGLLLDIYTDNGIVRNIDLTKKNVGTDGEPDDYQAITSSAIKTIGPSTVNTIKVTIDDNSFLVPTSMEIYTNDDLEQFIKWNVEDAGSQKVKATLVKPNVTLSAEMAQLLADNSDVDLTIEGKETLTLAEGVVSNLLDLENVHINCGIEVKGTLNLTEDSELNNIAIAVEEGATLNITESLDSKTKGADITNEGNVSIAENAKVPDAVTFNNKAEMEIAANADVRGKVTNNANAVIDNAGYIREVENAGATNEKDEDGVINLTGKGTIAGGLNDGIINAGADTRVTVKDEKGEGEIIIELGAKVETNDKNTVAYETGDLEIDETVLKALKETTNATIEKLILTGDVEITADKTAAAFDIIAAQTGSSLTVSDDAADKLKVNKELIIEGNAETDGAIEAAKVTVKKDVTLNNYGDINVTGTFTNDGEVNNHGTVSAKAIDGTEGKNGFSYNDPFVNDGQFETILKSAVVKFMNESKVYSSTFAVTLGDAKTENTFKYVMENEYWQDYAEVKALKAREEYKTLTQAQLDAAVKAIESDTANKTTLINALKAATGFVAQSIAYETKTGTDATEAAYAAFKEAVVKKNAAIVGTLNNEVTYSVARTANNLSEIEIDGILEAAKPQMYVWKDATCPLYDVMTVAMVNTKSTWASVLTNLGWQKGAPIETFDELNKWMKAVAAYEGTAPLMKDAVAKMGEHTDFSTWEYEEGQFTALRNAFVK